MPPRSDTRSKMITSAALMLRERGYGGTSFARVIEDADAPRGSIGHHFPGGKREMVAEAVRFAGDAATAAMRHSMERGDSAAELFSMVCDFYRRALLDTEFAAGCPVGAVAQEAYNDPELAGVLAAVFTDWRSVMSAAIAADGREREAADDLAELCISAVEGALILCRVESSAGPLERIERQVVALLE